MMIVYYFLVTHSKAITTSRSNNNNSPLCNIKLDASILYIACFTWLLGLFIEEPFLRTIDHNVDYTIVSITPRTGPSVANAISAKVREADTPQSHFIRYKPYVKRGTSLA